MKYGKKTVVLSIVIVAIAALAIFAVYSYTEQKDPAPHLTCTATSVDNFGNYTLSLSPDDFFESGFVIGDNITVTVDGLVLPAVFVKNYSGAPPYELAVSANSFNNTTSLFLFNGTVSKILPIGIEGPSICIDFTGHGDLSSKYPEITKGIDSEMHPGQTIENFANYRDLTLGDLHITRCINPVNIDKIGLNRAKICDDLLSNAQSFLDIGNTETGLKKYIASLKEKGICNNIVRIYDSDNMRCSFVHADYIIYSAELKPVFEYIIEKGDENIALSCNHGKDRTGIVFMVLESLAGWSIDELSKDYCLSFCNLYGIAEGSEEYKLIEKNYFGRVIYMMANPDEIQRVYEIDWDSIDYKSIDAKEAAENFLLNNVKLTQEQVDELKAMLNP